MKLNTYTLFVFLFLSVSQFCLAFELPYKSWVDFEGTLGDKLIQFSLYRFQNNTIRGNYCNLKNGYKVYFDGKIINQTLRLDVYSKGKIKEQIVAKISVNDLDSLNGFVFRGNEKHSLKLKFTAMSGGSYRQRYVGFEVTNKEVEKFASKVKESISHEKRAWLLQHISYPIGVRLNDNVLVMKNKVDFERNFNQIFTAKIKDKIKNSCICNLFSNDQGVMLGDGEIWIRQSNSIKHKFEARIVAINN